MHADACHDCGHTHGVLMGVCGAPLGTRPGVVSLCGCPHSVAAARSPEGATLEPTAEQFAIACRNRMEALYRTDNGAYGDGSYDPLERFRATPGEFRREAERAISAFWQTWESENK